MKTSITARICGNDYSCAIPRDRLHMFEALNGSANALLTRLRDGLWSAEDIRATLVFAIDPPSAKAGMPDVLLRANAAAASRDTAIDKAFIANGAGAYRLLAAAVLVAALFGIDDDAAVFSDEVTD